MKLKTALLVSFFCIAPVMANAAQDSLFFTQDELVAISRANRGYVAKKDDVVQKATEDATTAPVDRGRRVIKLSGIVYQGPKEWTIWLNGQRVTPKNIPNQVSGLTVDADHILLKWYDTAEQRLVTVTLHPHQKYNLDQDSITSDN
jgi:hypothetical protein